MQGARFLIAGRVQRVGFRAFVKRAADALGIAGCARNLQDGRVEVIALGESATLDRLELRLREGPISARVDRVDREALIEQSLDRDFASEFSIA